MKEAEELRTPTEEYYAQPLEDNLFEWHFTLRGPPNSEFEGGIYHGRITLPHDYPMKPPSIILLTPNGRFEINKKICLSISGHHPESWQPSWSIRTALLAIIGFLPTHGNGAIGSLDYTPEERKRLALNSQNWKCPECGYIKGCLKSPESDVQKVETVPLSCANGSSTAKPEISCQQNIHSGETTKMETIETNFIHEQCKSSSDVICTETTHVMNLPNVVEGTPENALTVRQRKLAPSRLSAESVESDMRSTQSVDSDNLRSTQSVDSDNVKSTQSVEPDNVRSTQSSRIRSFHNYGSLIMIWLILVMIFLLILRRWLFYDYSL